MKKNKFIKFNLEDLNKINIRDKEYLSYNLNHNKIIALKGYEENSSNKKTACYFKDLSIIYWKNLLSELSYELVEINDSILESIIENKNLETTNKLFFWTLSRSQDPKMIEIIKLLISKRNGRHLFLFPDEDEDSYNFLKNLENIHFLDYSQKQLNKWNFIRNLK